MRTIACMAASLLLCATALAADFTGTWKLNPDKSKIHNPDLAANTMKIEKTGPRTFHVTIDLTFKSGKTTHSEAIRVYDGQEHPAQGVGFRPGTTETCEESSAGVRKITDKQDGKVILEIQSTLSEDGKSMTNLRSWPDGSEVWVFDKQ